MSRRQFLFLVICNSLITLVIVLGVVWAVERRRPDPVVLAPEPTPPLVDSFADVVPASEPPTSEVAPGETPIVSRPTPTPAPDAPPEVVAREEERYVVQPGDSLLAIALRYDLTLAELMEANNLRDPDVLFVGQELIIPASARPAPQPTPTPQEVVENPAQVVIASIESRGQWTDEAVVLTNEGGRVADLAGWTLIAPDGRSYTFPGVALWPGGTLRLFTGPGSDTAGDLFWGLEEAVWGGDDVVVVLRDGSAAVVAEYRP